MSLYRCTIANDGSRRQIVIHWDDNDANRIIVAPVAVPTSELNEERLIHEIGRMGFRLASTESDNVERGWAIVAHLRKDWPFYNPLDGSWHAFLDDETKRSIRERWPDADVPGVH